MINYFSFSILLISLFAYSFGFSQSEIISELIIVDTTTYNGKSIYVFNDKSWEFADEYNITYHYETVRDSLGCVLFDKEQLMSINWNENKTFSNQFNLSLAEDSIKINISEYVPPVVGKPSSNFKIRWGKWHKGIDYALPIGSEVKAAFDGVVRYSKYNYGGYGELMILRHYNGLETYYAHLSKRMFKSGDIVKAGEVIALSGNTGHSTGPHLHFEIRILDNAFDPGVITPGSKKILIHKGLFYANSAVGKKCSLHEAFNILESDINGFNVKSEISVNRRRVRNTGSNL